MHYITIWKVYSVASLKQNMRQNQSNSEKYFIQCSQSGQTNEYFRSLFITTPCATFHWLSHRLTYEQFNFMARWVYLAINSEMENCNNCIFRHNSRVKSGGNCFPLSELLRMMHSTKYVSLSICLWRSLDAAMEMVIQTILYTSTKLISLNFISNLLIRDWLLHHYFFFWLGNIIFNSWINFSPHIG